MMRFQRALSGLPPIGLAERNRDEHDAMMRLMRSAHHGEGAKADASGAVELLRPSGASAAV